MEELESQMQRQIEFPKKLNSNPHLFLWILFSFFCLVHPPFPRQFFFPRILSFWDLRCTLASGEKATSKGLGFGDSSGRGRPAGKKENPSFGALKQVRTISVRMVSRAKLREAADTFNFLRHVMRAILSVRPKCSHRCVSLKETPLKPVQILKHTTKNSAEQTVMRTKWFKHIAI